MNVDRESMEKVSRLRGIRFISFWMVLVTFPGILYFGLEKARLPMILFEAVCYGGLILAATGLFIRKNWARKLALLMLLMSFIFNLYVVSFLIGPGYTASLEWLMIEYQFSEKLLKGIVPTLLVLYILWPVVAILFLLNPKVKRLFNRSRQAAASPDEDLPNFSRNSSGYPG